jgi:hypothetical protein
MGNFSEYKYIELVVWFSQFSLFLPYHLVTMMYVLRGRGRGGELANVKSSRVILPHFQNPFSLTIVGLEGVKQQVERSISLACLFTFGW